MHGNWMDSSADIVHEGMGGMFTRLCFLFYALHNFVHQSFFPRV